MAQQSTIEFLKGENALVIAISSSKMQVDNCTEYHWDGNIDMRLIIFFAF